MISAIDPILRGVAVGAFIVTGLAVWRSDLAHDSRLATLLVCLSAAAWTLTESVAIGPAVRQVPLLPLLAFPVAGFFWQFVATVIEDRPLSALTLTPAALFVLAGVGLMLAPDTMARPLGVAFNIAAAALSLHAVWMVLRGWRGDLVAGRRSLRGAILGFAALFAAFQGGTGVLRALAPDRPWAALAIGQPSGGAIVAALGLALGVLFLSGRAPLFPAARPRTDAADPRVAAAERVLLDKLTGAMDAGAWRNERLAIGALARDLDTPEHQLRRLINGRLGHRNFADFLNGYRIDAAKARLADVREARTTIAEIAFDVGFGSLSPFNRAFRAMTGSTPTAWRRSALQTSAISAEAD